MQPNPKTFLQKLIKLAFTFETNKDLFYEKFVATIDVEALKEYGIIEVDSTNPELTPQEAELYSLIEAGFTPEELCVIYKKKNLNSIYIKRHRLNKKLKGSCSLEVLEVMVFLMSGMLMVLHLLQWLKLYP